MLKRVAKGVKAKVLNRFFGQKPQEEPKKDAVASQERVESDSMSEQSFNPFKNSLSRTRQIFSRMGDVFRQNDITPELWDELEESLLRADVGPSTTMWLIERLQQRVNEEKMKSGAQVQRALREELTKLLGKSAGLRFAPDSTLTVILVIGVNGSGKTTTIAKLAYRLTREGHRVVLAAADTFRAAVRRHSRSRQGSDFRSLQDFGSLLAQTATPPCGGCEFDCRLTSSQHRRCLVVRCSHRGYRGSSANEVQPDGRAEEDQ